MNIRFEKIVATLERDIAQTARNQVVIDKLKRPTLRGKLMVLLFRRPFATAFVLNALIWIFLALGAVVALAADPSSPSGSAGGTCPNPGEKCKVIFLSPQEENLLVGQNGILDTAAQGRQIDLGGFAVYFKSKIATAPQGEVKAVEKPAQEQK